MATDKPVDILMFIHPRCDTDVPTVNSCACLPVGDECDVCGAMCTCTPDFEQVDDAVSRAIEWAAEHSDNEMDEKVLTWVRANVYKLF